MNIIHIDELADGVKIATLTDDEGNVIGQNIFSPESEPQPEVGPWPRPGVWSRLWGWVTG